jgi:D-amino peptidase
MLEHLAPRLFRAQRLEPLLTASLEACAHVSYGFELPLDGDRLQAGIDAWFCRRVRGLPHAPPDSDHLATALAWMRDDNAIYTWLLGELAARCGLDVRVPFTAQRPFLHTSRLHDAYFLTHLVMLETDYFARPLTHPKAPEWADVLEALVPWLEKEPNVDLAGEVALCLRFLKRNATAALALIERARPTDSHAQATVLLAHSVE